MLLYVTVLRVGDAWLVGVGKRSPHGFRCLYCISIGSLVILKAYYALFPQKQFEKADITGLCRVGKGSAG